jgi:hypothetical protein
VSGRILARTPTAIDMDIGAGRVTLSMNSVLRIEEGRSPLHDYDDRVNAMRAGDRDGWVSLARWAEKEGLGTQARKAWEQVVTIDKSHAEANRALGRVEFDGRWITPEESYRARGYVPFEGAWVTPVELDALLRERAAVAEAERTRIDAERRVLEAEARMLEAEARARDAYLGTSVLVAPTIPGWYGGRGRYSGWGVSSSWGSWGAWGPMWGTEPVRGPSFSKGSHGARSGGSPPSSRRTPAGPPRQPASRGSGAGGARRK